MLNNVKQLAVVVPVYGNENSLRALYERIDKATRGIGVELILQFVNDRSPDNSQQILEQLAKEDSRVRILLLSKNHGSFIAMVAGLAETKDCDAAIIISADLQDPPEIIPEMVRKWREGKQVVLCIRRRRGDSFITRFFSQLYFRIYNKLVMADMPKGGFDFCLIDRRVIQVIVQSSEKSTSLIGLIIWAGFQRAYIPYDRLKREHGKSMWTFNKKLRYALNGVIAFSSWPLKIFTVAGALLGALSIFYAGLVLYRFFSGAIPIAGWTSLMLVILFIGTFQFIAIGILGEYFWHNLEQTRKRPLFIVDKRLGNGCRRVGDEGALVPFFDPQSVSRPVIHSLVESSTRLLHSSELILGLEVERFERSLASFIGTTEAVGVASGTDAITLGLWALGIKPGDYVITPAISAPATAVAILRSGAKPLFVDVNPQTLTISAIAVEEAVKHQRVKAIVPVHLYGNPCDIDALCKIASEHNIVILEDCAQSLGTTIDGRSCGTFSRVAAFSFYPTKNLGAYGDAGVVVTLDAELAKKIRKMRFYGQDSSGECVSVGLNSRLDTIQAALLSERLKVIEQQNKQRLEIARRYDKELAFLNPVPSRDGRVPHLYVVRPHDRQGFRDFLSSEGVNTAVHYPLPLTKHEYLQKNGLVTSCPFAEDASRHVVSLPCFPGMTPEQVKKCIQACKSWSDLNPRVKIKQSQADRQQ